MLTFTENLPLALYIHLPWCVKKCPYCDFNSHEFQQVSNNEQDYVAALIRDLDVELPRIWGRRIQSIFIGGGTPSLFSGRAINDLLSAIHARLNYQPNIEITLEANPGTVDAANFSDYKKAGVNRLSIGVQSFADSQLRQLGRIHDFEQAIRAFNTARDAGFENINIDLMYGLPGQTISEATQDLQQAIQLQPEHISWYQLTIEPNTVFYSQPPTLPDDDELWDMQCHGQSLLQLHGYQQYEVSAWAKGDQRCRHNISYWQFGDYIGIGAGAHGKLTLVSENRIMRTQRHRIPSSYMQKTKHAQATVEEKTLSRSDIPFEFMLNALRLTGGFASSLFLRHCGMPLSVISRPLDTAERQGLIHWQRDHLQPTEKGRQYLNDLMQMFLNEA